MASTEGPATGPGTPDDLGRGLPVVHLAALEAQARQQLPTDVFDYYAGGSGAETTLAEALPEVVQAVRDDAEVDVDGGIRSGSDVLTALALGARAVFLVRPTAWGLATGGADGVARVLGGLTEELAHTMAVCGLDDVRAVPLDTGVRAPWTAR